MASGASSSCTDGSERGSRRSTGDQADEGQDGRQWMQDGSVNGWLIAQIIVPTFVVNRRVHPARVWQKYTSVFGPPCGDDQTFVTG